MPLAPDATARAIRVDATSKKRVTTRFGDIAYAEAGQGFPTVFLHGLGQSAYFWRHQLADLSDRRRCLAFDLMAHGQTEAVPGQDVSFREQAAMILEALSTLDVATFDLVLNDSGGAVGQIMAVTAPQRVRSMVLTNCDVHDNWPPVALSEIRGAAQEGKLADMFGHFVHNPNAFRAPGSIAEMVYEDADFASDEAIGINLGPIISSDERKAAFNRYAGMQDHSQLVAIEDDLRRLDMPCLIVWGTDDVFFATEWAYWLKDALSGAREVVEIVGAKLFFPEERPDLFNTLVRRFWSSLS